MQETIDRSTHFVFEHRVFNVKGAMFSFTADGAEPAFYVTLGDLKAALRLPALRNEFGIAADSADGKLLGVVERSLRFVKEIRPGDSIPREILDGSASWSVEAKHRAIAHGRLTMQVISWLAGKETIVSDQRELMRLVDDPETKARVQKGAAEMAEKLGLGINRKQEVVDHIDNLARELSYIEALRDRFALVRQVIGKINHLVKLYRADRTLVQEISRVHSLLLRPLSEFENIFGEVDGATCEILTVLKKFDTQVKFIRETRDELHVRLMLWDPVIEQWQPLDPVRGGETEAALKEMYRFAARHFPQRQDWRLGSN